MDTPRGQAESRDLSITLSKVVQGIMIVVFLVAVITIGFTIKTYIENNENQQALSQKISNAEANLLGRIHDVRQNVIVTRDGIVGMRENIMEIREINEGILTRLGASGSEEGTTGEGTGSGNYVYGPPQLPRPPLPHPLLRRLDSSPTPFIV